MVEHGCAGPLGGARQRNRQPRIIELAIPVAHRTAQVVGAHPWHFGKCLGAAQEPGFAQPRLAGEKVIQHQTGTIEPLVEQQATPPVNRHHERQRLRQMRRVGHQRGALVQCFTHQRYIALGQIPHATVQEFGGSGGRALGKVFRLDQRHIQATVGGINRHTKAGRAAANHQQIENLIAAQPVPARGPLLVGVGGRGGRGRV